MFTPEQKRKASEKSKALLLVVGVARKFSNHIADDLKFIDVVHSVIAK